MSLVTQVIPFISYLTLLAVTISSAYADSVKISSACNFRQGSSGELIVGSTLLLVDQAMDDGGLVIHPSGKIGQVGRFSNLTRSFPDASFLDCRGETVLSPGWVNTHEHEAFSYTFPDPNLKPIYHHREEWIFGKNGMKVLPIPNEQIYKPENKKSLAVLSWVELRHLVTGTTSLGGPGAVQGLVKNINRSANPPKNNRYPLAADLEIFPFSMDSIEFFSDACLGDKKSVFPLKIDSQTDLAYAPHLGEGRRDNCTAQSELETYIDYVSQHQESGRRFSAVHAVAGRPDQLKRFADFDISLVWSPRSNLALYGETIDLAASQRYNVRMALGTDWSSSGSFNMLEEFECARTVIRSQEIDLSAYQLWLMATHNAAYAVGLENIVGAIKPGLAADLILINKSKDQSPYQAAVNANIDDVRIVWVDGTPLIASKSIVKVLKPNPVCVDLPMKHKTLCVDFNILGVSWEDMNKLTTNAVPFNGSTKRQAPCDVT
ncbi:MAG: cytosine/adenosine deaminase-related metal-dependent hydrolase [Halioglobus sp.]|jgi:cytosine/adenosine deaminase-related metal-dependent hydrolase